MRQDCDILVVDDDVGLASNLHDILEAEGYDAAVAHGGRSALTLCREKVFKLALLDIRLPDMEGIELLTPLREMHPDMAVMMITGYASVENVVQALNQGALAYITKPLNIDEVLAKVRDILEKQRLAAGIRNLPLVDELTGLHNRRGFMLLAQQQLKLANRTKKGMFLLFADVDNLKWINDALGHLEGDQALIEVANILRGTFRCSDIIARIGGDEFVVLLIEARNDSAEVLISRLQENLDTHNARRKRRYRLSLSVGRARYDPKCPCSIDELLNRADISMYERKRDKQKAQVNKMKYEGKRREPVIGHKRKRETWENNFNIVIVERSRKPRALSRNLNEAREHLKEVGQ
jgi:two-component system cell cycle response regulator